MQTFTAQMPINRDSSPGGVVLIELIIAVMVIGLLTMLAFLNMTGMVGKSRFETKMQELINIMEMACESASRTDNKYEVVFDPTNQTYVLQEMVVDGNDFTEDNIIETGQFDQEFWLSYVQFDDYESTTEDTAIFRAGKAGYQYGGKIVILDENANPYSIIVSRISCRVMFEKGDVEMIVPRDKDAMPF